MKDASTENMVVTLHLHNGWSIRRIARDLNLSRNCVRRILKGNTISRDKHPEEQIPLKKQRSGKLEPYKVLIAILLEKYPKITGQRVHEHLIEAGYEGGITLCRGYLKSIRAVGEKKPIRMVETEPGQLAIHDWSDYQIPFTEDGQEHNVTFFSYILAYSRRQYITVVEDKTQQTLFRSLIAAFIYMDGVPRQIRSDNQKACVDHWEPGNPVFNRKYLEFATWYRYVPKTITPRNPTENLKIERPFWYLEQNFLNGREFKDEEDLRNQLQQWLAETNDLRIHATTKKRPLDMYKEEHPYLQGLPTGHYDTAEVVYKVVNKESCIYWEGYQYVVSAKYMYELCAVRITANQMIIYSPQGEQIACHPLAEKGRKNRYVGYNSPAQKKAELVTADVIQRLEHFGPDMAEFIQLIKQHNPSSWRHHLKHILALRVNYREQDIMVAIRRAWEYKVFESGPIERFLNNNAESRYSFKLSFKPNNNDYD